MKASSLAALSIPGIAFAAVLGARVSPGRHGPVPSPTQLRYDDPAASTENARGGYGASASAGVLLSEAPVADGYRVLREAEEDHERAFREALDPEATRAARVERATALAAREATDPELVALGKRLFIEDWPGATHVPLEGATRCAACHYRSGIGGSGGLADGQSSHLNPPALFGAALLERAAAEISRDLREKRNRNRPLISHGIDFGTATHPKGVAPDLVIRPFGRSGRWATIDEAVADMSREKLHVTSSPGERRALEAFISSLDAPTVEPPDAARMTDLFMRFERGRRAFNQLGCAECHLPEIVLDDGTVVRAWTDLRQHDMGDSTWLTAPLWGIAASAPYLHDGRALASLDAAILAHGGEAQRARDAYLHTDDQTRGDVNLLLVSLIPKARIRIAGR